jgi:lysophospholipase L1-like esterase
MQARNRLILPKIRAPIIFAPSVNQIFAPTVDMKIPNADMKMRSIILFLQVLLAYATLAGCAEREQLFADTDDVQAPTAPIELLALGDSYTIGQSVAEADRWPNQLAKKLKDAGFEVARTQIIARTGWTTANLTSAIQTQKPDSNFNLVGLLIGVNNQYQGRTLAEYETQFTQLLQTAIVHAHGNKQRVFVVSIPDYGFTPYGQSNQASISAALDQFNAANLRITQAAGIQYFDITPISRNGLADPSLVAGDGLHPSGKQYTQWVELMLPIVGELVK